MNNLDRLSVVIPVLHDRAGIDKIHHAYKAALSGNGWALDFIYVVDGRLDASLSVLQDLRDRGEEMQILHLVRPHGEATALSVGFRHAAGSHILTLTDIPQIEPEALPQLLAASDDADLLIAQRMPAEKAGGKGLSFDRLARWMLGGAFNDLRSGVRLMRRQVAEEIVLYGNQHRFLPLIAESHGFIAREIPLPAARKDRKPVTLGDRSNLVMDMIAAFFLIRFVRRPFRFFGGIGLAVLVPGALITAWLVLARLAFAVPLLDRPALILSTLMVVLGIQIIAVGLIGEIITFAYTREQKDYKVERIVE